MSSIPQIWVLKDDRPGHSNQAYGVAEALGFPFTIKSITYTKKADWPNFLKGSSLKGISEESKQDLQGPWPDIVIGAGRRVAPVAKYIKRKSGGKTKLVQLMWPGFPASGFDLIAVPEHDHKKPKKHIMVTTGTPHRVSPAVLDRESEIWRTTLDVLPTPRVALLIGGDTHGHVFTEKHAAMLGASASSLAEKLGGSLLVTTSRRTSKKAKASLEESISSPMYLHDPDTERTNPYFAFLGLSDVIIVTGDSMSMCSESCATGKPVYIYAPEDITSPKHAEFHESLFAQKFAKPFLPKEIKTVYQALKETTQSPPPPLNTASEIAQKIKSLFLDT